MILITLLTSGVLAGASLACAVFVIRSERQPAVVRARGGEPTNELQIASPTRMNRPPVSRRQPEPLSRPAHVEDVLLDALDRSGERWSFGSASTLFEVETVP